MGLGKYLNIDPVIVRIFFLLLAATGYGILIYLVLWIVIPREDLIQEDGSTIRQPGDIGERAKMMGSEIQDAASQVNKRLPLYIGIGLLIIGGFALLRALPYNWAHYIDAFIWPALLVAAGIVLLVRGSSKGG